VLAAPGAEVPLTVRDLVLARFSGLPTGAREVVRLVLRMDYLEAVIQRPAVG
jgi:hypothetical protein